MATPIIPKTNSDLLSTSAPPANALVAGEIASNATAGDLYIKKNDGTVVQIGKVKKVANVSPDSTGNITLVASDVGAIAASEKGANSGVATLDSAGKLTTSQIPASLVGAVNYVGVWDASANSPTLASGVGTKGNYYKVNVAGSTSINGHSVWTVGDVIIFNGTTWDKIDGQDSEVLTVAGVPANASGNIPLTPADIGAVPTSQKGVASGVASLGSDGVLPEAQTPIATASRVGGVKQGSNVTIGPDGTISAANSYVLPVALDAVLGGVKSGDDVIVDPVTGEMTLNSNVLRDTTPVSGGTY
jgi:hypothetical protein